LHTTFAIESDDSPAPGIIPALVRVHDQPAGTTALRGARPAARLRVRRRPPENPVSSEPTNLEVV
jgi:hypothetical protein